MPWFYWTFIIGVILFAISLRLADKTFDGGFWSFMATLILIFVSVVAQIWSWF